ncbi:hypothetical protein HDF11_003156 [Tunturiibacter psychrotolerans]
MRSIDCLGDDSMAPRFRFSALSSHCCRYEEEPAFHPRTQRNFSLNAAKNVETNVRSELIFRARETVDNKYKLCQTASKATRRLHISARNTTDTINDAFSRIAGGDESSLPENPILALS